MSVIIPSGKIFSRTRRLVSFYSGLERTVVWGRSQLKPVERLQVCPTCFRWCGRSCNMEAACDCGIEKQRRPIQVQFCETLGGLCRTELNNPYDITLSADGDLLIAHTLWKIRRPINVFTCSWQIPHFSSLVNVSRLFQQPRRLLCSSFS